MTRLPLLFALLVGLSTHIQAQRFHSNPFPHVDETRVSGTTGTPLGGFGAGGLKFDANSGSFAIATRPPADAFDFIKVADARFELVVHTAGSTDSTHRLCSFRKNGLATDDAVFPLHRVAFACQKGMEASLTAFTPLSPENYEDMTLPYAFYEIHLKNTGKRSSDLSFSLYWKSDEAFKVLTNRGIHNNQVAIAAMVEGRKAIQKGELLSENRGCVTIKVRLSPGEKRTLKYVVAWYDRTDPQLAWYKNQYGNPAAIALHGLDVFDRLKTNAEKLVDNMRASNLPDWFESQSLNILANLVTNSMYKKDGRLAFAEGQWTCFGTMDQMWLARSFVNQMLPEFAWKELEYWARTQMKNGQIHHDFNRMEAPNNALRSQLVDWDDTEHKDYRNIQRWVDLNAAFVISVFETWRQSGNKEKMHALWPYVKKATNRIFDQLKAYGDPIYPYTFSHSENSYDAGGEPDPYNAGLTAATFRILSELAPLQGDTALGLRCRSALDTLLQSFRNRYLNDSHFLLSKHCESYFSGQWLVNHLNLGDLWTDSETDWVLEKLNGYYKPLEKGLGYEKGTYDEWLPYLLTHYGGLLLQSGQASTWLVLQRDSYLRQYLNRDKVFDHPLNILPLVTEPKLTATSVSSDKQYISMPALWRNYMDVVGFKRDAVQGDIWLKPNLPAEWGTRLENAMFLSEKGYGKLSFHENDNQYRTRTFNIASEMPLAVTRIHLKDDFSDSITVLVNDSLVRFFRSGSGYSRELVFDWKGVVTSKGLDVTVSGTLRKKASKKYASDLEAKIGTEKTVSYTQRDPYGKLEVETCNNQGGLVFEGKDTCRYATSLDNFDFAEFSNVEFGQHGATSMDCRIRDIDSDGAIEVLLDGVAGELIGTCPVRKTTAEDWMTVSCPIRKPVGQHAVTLRFVTQTESRMKLDWIRFR